jgi:hypothetical protein
MGWMRDRRVLAALATGYAVALVVLVGGPWGWALNRLTVACYVQLRHDWPIAPDWVGPEDYGTLLNVVLFVPFGVLLVLLASCPWWLAAVVAAASSAVVEGVQGLWLDRVGSWGDVGANTVGALVGAAAVSLLARGGSRRAGRPGPRRPR